MSYSSTCSWCHSVNTSQARWCKTCGHAAQLCRSDCDCLKCAGLFAAAADSPTIVHDARGGDVDRGPSTIPYGGSSPALGQPGQVAPPTPTTKGNHDATHR